MTVKTIIGDEDSTTIARLKANVDKTISKKSDGNHIRKIFGNALYSLRKEHKCLSIATILYLKKLFRYMLAQSKGKPDMVEEGLKSIPEHIFGNHLHCGKWCHAQKHPGKKYIYKSLPHGRPLSDASLKTSLVQLFNSYIRQSDKLASLGSTQSNESLNKSISSKAPKTHHYSSSSSLNYRVAASVAQKNIGQKYVMIVSKSFELKFYASFIVIVCLIYNERHCTSILNRNKSYR